MNKYPYLPPFKAFVLQNFPFIEEDFDALTYYEILCKIIERLQLTQEQVEKITEIINNFDIQEEVDKKLDEMAEDGTLERLINQAILVNKVDYYKIDNTITDSDLQELFDIERAKVIDFTDGTYNFTSTFRLNSHTKLLCNNAVINTTQTHLFFNFKDTDTTVLQYNGQHNIEIIGGTFNAGFSFIHGKNITIKNARFYHILNDHCIEICACNNFKVDSCRFEGVIAQNESRQHVENVQIDNCNYEAFPWLPEGSSTFDGTPNLNIDIGNNVFLQPNSSYMLYTAIGSHAFIEGSVHQFITIHNNYINEPFNDAIRLHNSRDVVIKDNFITSNSTFKTKDREAISMLNGCQRITVNNNIINGFATHMYISNGSYIININNNIFKNLAYQDENNDLANSIKYREVQNLVINSNTFENILGSIIYNYDKDNTGSNMEFTNNNIYMTSTFSNIVGNRLRIYGTDKLYIVGNNVQENLTDINGYFLRASQYVKDIVFKNNSITNLQGNSIKIFSPNGYVGNYNNFYDVIIPGYSGNEEITTNTQLSVPFTDFNKILVVCGSSSDTLTIPLYDFNPINDKLEPRTWIFSGWKSSSTTPIKCVLTLNNDNTFLFTASDTSYHIRRIDFINE